MQRYQFHKYYISFLMKKIILAIKLILRSKFIFKTPQKFDLIIFSRIPSEMTCKIKKSLEFDLKRNSVRNDLYFFLFFF